MSPDRIQCVINPWRYLPLLDQAVFEFASLCGLAQANHCRVTTGSGHKHHWNSRFTLRIAKLHFCTFRWEPSLHLNRLEPSAWVYGEQPHPYDGAHLLTPSIRIRWTSREWLGAENQPRLPILNKLESECASVAASKPWSNDSKQFSPLIKLGQLFKKLNLTLSSCPAQIKPSCT